MLQAHIQRVTIVDWKRGYVKVILKATLRNIQQSFEFIFNLEKKRRGYFGDMRKILQQILVFWKNSSRLNSELKSSWGRNY